MRHNIPYIVKSVVISLDIFVVPYVIVIKCYCNILQEIIKILHEKILKGITYRFRSDTLEKNNSLNGRSNEPLMNG